MGSFFKRSVRTIILIVIICSLYYFVGLWMHKRMRPWAYADASGTPVLLGKWVGTFKDPDGVVKTMQLEIIEPRKRFLDRPTKHDHKIFYDDEFEGFAAVTGKLGTEHHRLKGILASEDGHQIGKVNFIPEDDKKQIRKSFNVAQAAAGGTWNGDSLVLPLEFTYRTETGSAMWDSSDPRYEKKVRVALIRAGARSK